MGPVIVALIVRSRRSRLAPSAFFEVAYNTSLRNIPAHSVEYSTDFQSVSSWSSLWSRSEASVAAAAAAAAAPAVDETLAHAMSMFVTVRT